MEKKIGERRSEMSTAFAYKAIFHSRVTTVMMIKEVENVNIFSIDVPLLYGGAIALCEYHSLFRSLRSHFQTNNSINSDIYFVNG